MVTQEDLYDFHARAFGFPAPKQQFHTSEESCNGAAYEEAFQLEDGDLGYYPDGVKRTLTDEQIAMFRHSEIYSILRARQVRRENLEAEGGEQSMGLDVQPEEYVKATVFLDEEGEVKSDGEVEEPLATVPDTTPQRVEYTQARKKRKRGDADVGYVHGRKQVSRSARGFVRELDSAAAENQILDYGDDTSAVEGSKENKFTTTQVAEQDRESRAHPAEGRKFWWPVIEAT